ncbi:hypothetical protein Hanom_Chr07g00582401 [Helianthus anomalus]
MAKESYEVTTHIKKPEKSLHQFSGSSNLQEFPLSKGGVSPFGISTPSSWRRIEPSSIAFPYLINTNSLYNNHHQ